MSNLLAVLLIVVAYSVGWVLTGDPSWLPHLILGWLAHHTAAAA